MRGQDFADAFLAAFGCAAQEFETDPTVRQRIRDASPVFLVTPDDPPALLMAASGEGLAALRDRPVPPVINDPHSVWHSVLLGQVMRDASVSVVMRLGPDVGRSPAADNTAIVTFLREHLGETLSRQE